MPEPETPPEVEAPAPSLPARNLEAALPDLRRPFAPSAIKWKVQAEGPKHEQQKDYVVVIGYIDARLVMERLNKVVAGAWSEKPIRVEGKAEALMYELTLFDTTHVDVGVSQGDSEGMKLKAVHSDALKRTAVRFGVGVSLYAMPKMFIDVTANGELKEDKPTIKRRSDGKAGYLRQAHEDWLRRAYEDWLQAEGEEKFGAPLDHGDAAAGSVGDLVEGDDETAESEKPAALEDDKAKELGAEARKIRDEIREVDPESLAEQSFDAAMAQREHSHDRLEDFIANLRELLANVQRFDNLTDSLRQVLDDDDLKKVIDTAKRRGSRAERVEVLEKALAEATAAAGEEPQS